MSMTAVVYLLSRGGCCHVNTCSPLCPSKGPKPWAHSSARRLVRCPAHVGPALREALSKSPMRFVHEHECVSHFLTARGVGSTNIAVSLNFARSWCMSACADGTCPTSAPLDVCVSV